MEVVEDGLLDPLRQELANKTTEIYARPVPPCLDIYVWISERSPEVFGQFIDCYVNVDDPGDEQFHAFEQVYVLGIANGADNKALDRLRFGIRPSSRSHATGLPFSASASTFQTIYRKRCNRLNGS
ncbi:hypothetical protein [Acrocarpospora catenulata]|uniref:hypothetical protein n=1 Tax=Acrocarpospora catenulata TaxID=2836182 RepID=UPI001BDB4233|nr:hypothetical protein [Acrocarpospora catenulata]